MILSDDAAAPRPRLLTAVRRHAYNKVVLRVTNTRRPSQSRRSRSSRCPASRDWNSPLGARRRTCRLWSGFDGSPWLRTCSRTRPSGEGPPSPATGEATGEATGPAAGARRRGRRRHGEPDAERAEVLHMVVDARAVRRSVRGRRDRTGSRLAWPVERPRPAPTAIVAYHVRKHDLLTDRQAVRAVWHRDPHVRLRGATVLHHVGVPQKASGRRAPQSEQSLPRAHSPLRESAPGRRSCRRRQGKVLRRSTAAGGCRSTHQATGAAGSGERAGAAGAGAAGRHVRWSAGRQGRWRRRRGQHAAPSAVAAVAAVGAADVQGARRSSSSSPVKAFDAVIAEVPEGVRHQRPVERIALKRYLRAA